MQYTKSLHFEYVKFQKKKISSKNDYYLRYTNYTIIGKANTNSLNIVTVPF